MLFCVNDPAPLPGSKGRRDFDRPTPVTGTPGTRRGTNDACSMAGRSLASPRHRWGNGCGRRWPAGWYVPHGRSGDTALGPAPPDRALRSRRPFPGPGSKTAGTCPVRPCPGRSGDGRVHPSCLCPHSLDGLTVRIEEASGTEVQCVLILGKDHTSKVISVGSGRSSFRNQ